MFDTTPAISQYALLALAALVILLSRLGGSQRAPRLLLISRWLRWLLFAAIFSYLLKEFELSMRPDWVHFVTGLALWFLCETGYNWIVINALSRSDIPLFPHFKLSEGDDSEWLADRQLSKLKDWLEDKNFKCRAILKASLFEDMVLKSSIYESPDRTTRLHILFVPGVKKIAPSSYSLCTNGSGDQRLITDNHSLPFGGYYPGIWTLVRKPMIRSIKHLFKIHEKRLNKTDFEPAPFDSEPLEDLNQQQKLLENLNTKHGFLNPLRFRQENGRLTADGRYRLWKEMWLLAYLGRSVSQKTR